MEELDALRNENARLTAILYSIFRRHPDVQDWSLYLEDVDEDSLPQKIHVGWNIVGNDAIVTLVFGDSLRYLEGRTSSESPQQS